MACIDDEIRRRDIGKQYYGGGTPKFPTAVTDRHGLSMKAPKLHSASIETSHGNLEIPSHKQDLGFMPTAEAVFFLRDQYQSSRFDAYPTRYYRRGGV